MQPYNRQEISRNIEISEQMQINCSRSINQNDNDDFENHLQDEYENRNYHKALDPEDFTLSRTWTYRCRICDGNTKLSSKLPRCNQCGFAQSKNNKEAA